MPEAPQGGARATAVTMTVAEVALLFIPGSGNSGPAVIGQAPPGQVAVNNLIRGAANITYAGTSTGFSLRCRRGNGTGGTQVGTTQVDARTAASVTSQNVPFEFQDLANPTPAAGYTITGAAAVANNTVNEIVASIDDGS